MSSQVLEGSLRLVFCLLLACPCDCGNRKGLGCVRGAIEAELPMRGSHSIGGEKLTELKWAALRELSPWKPAAATGGKQAGGSLTCRLVFRPLEVSGWAADSLSVPRNQQLILSIVWELSFGWNV